MSNVVSRRIEFDADVVKRYEDMYPTKSFWWACNELLREFVEASEENPPINIMKSVARSVHGKANE